MSAATQGAKKSATSGRIEARFAALAAAGRAAFIPFLMAADPTVETSLEIVKGLPAAGADLIELGVMFSDPMADGPVIQAAGRPFTISRPGGSTMCR